MFNNLYLFEIYLHNSICYIDIACILVFRTKHVYCQEVINKKEKEKKQSLMSL